MNATPPFPRVAAVLALGLLALGFGSCGTTDPTTEALFLIDIENQWAVVNDPGHTFFFDPTDSSGAVSHASFTGNEGTPNGDQFDLSGSFNEHTINFTVDRNGQSVAYSGRITDETTMQITANGQTLTLKKGG